MKTVSVIGAGRLGTTLAHALSRKGYGIRFLCCRTAAAARKSVRIARAGTPAVNPVQAADGADIVILGVPDDEIGPMARKLAASSVGWRGKTVIHTSGFHSSGVLTPLKNKGAFTASLHPIQAFPRKDSRPGLFRGTYFGLEGDSGARQCGRCIVRRLGGRILNIRPDQKPLYHAALVLVSGGTTVLMEAAASCLESAGVDEKTAAKILVSLADETLRNVKRMGAERSLTGPFSRGDARTIRAHLQALAGMKPIADLYRELGWKSLGIVKKNKAPEARVRALKKILRGG